MKSQRVQRTQQLRRSNAAGKHEDKRTKRNRTRGEQRRNAIKEQ